VSDGGTPTHSSTAVLFVVVSSMGSYSGPLPPLFTSVPDDLPLRRDAAVSGTDSAPSRLELLYAGDWHWPGLLVGCLAVTVVVLAAFVIGISGCASRRSHRCKETQQHGITVGVSAVNGSTLRSVGGRRSSMPAEDKRRQIIPGDIVDVSAFDETEPEDDDDGSQSSPNQRKYFDAIVDLNTFVSSSLTVGVIVVLYIVI
jgi:hypothetical protein